MKLSLLNLIFFLFCSFVHADTTLDGYKVDSVQTLDVVGDCSLSTSAVGSARICFDQTLGKLQCSEDGGAYGDCVGGASSELVNRGWSLAALSPSSLTSSTTEVSAFGKYNGDLYVGYDSSGSATTAQATMYKWDGSTLSNFYTFGTGGNYVHVSWINEFNGKLYAGITGNQILGNGVVYVYDPLATVYYNVAFPRLGFTNTSKITIPNSNTSNAIFGSTAYSFEFYGKIDDIGYNTSNTGTIIDKRNTGATNGFNLTLTSGKALTVTIRDTATRTTTTSSTVNIGANNHIVVSWTSASAPKIYINGTEASYSVSAAATTPADDTANSITLGNNTSNNRAFGGTFRRFRIWRGYALTASDVTALYGGGSASSNPTGEYLFTEGSGTTIADNTGNGNTATLGSNVYWNTTKFEPVYAPGLDYMMYSSVRFRGSLYSGFGYTTGKIASTSDGINWSIAYSGLATYGLVNGMWVYRNKVFASLSGGGNGAIVSSPDGVNWTVEASGVASTGGFTNFAEFNGRLYVGNYNTSNQVYVRNDSAGTWSVIANFGSGISQCWALNNYNNALYVGCTDTTNKGTVYKSLDGYTYTVDFQNNTTGGMGAEVFRMINFNGGLYAGLGFSGTDKADIWRKNDSVGQLVDNINTQFNSLFGYQNSGVNWSVDNSVLQINKQTNFKENVGVNSLSPTQALDVIGSIRSSALTPSKCVQTDANGVLTSAASACGSGGSASAAGGTNAVQYNSGAATFAGDESKFSFNGTNVGIGTTNALNGILGVTGESYFNGNVGMGTYPGGTGSFRLVVSMLGNSQIKAISTAAQSTGSGAGIQTIQDDSTAMTAGNRLGFMTFGGSTNTTHSTGNGGSIEGLAADTWTTSSIPTDVVIKAAPSGSTTRSEIIRFASTGNVGINSSVPQQKLDVAGTVKATAFIGDGSGLTGLPSGSSQWTTINTNDVYLPNNGNVGIGTSATTTSALTVMDGNVGIGTWKPVALLHVNGSILANSTSVPSGANAALIAVGDGVNRAFEQFNAGSDTTGMLVWGGSGATSGNALRLRGNSTNGGTSYIFTDFATTEGDLVLGTYTNRTKQLYLSKNGNIGIGTTTPQGGLVVMNGNVGIGTFSPVGNLEIVDSTGSTATFRVRRGTSSATIGMSATMNGDTSDMVITPGGANGFAVTSNSGGPLGVNKTGCVGIGTTTPQGGLVVMNGNVGIGTWIPSQLLHVAGTIRYTSLVDTSGGLTIGSTYGYTGGSTTGTLMTLQGNSLTSGSALSISSSSGVLTGNLIRANYTGNSNPTAVNIGIGTLGTGDALLVTQQGTGNVVKFEDVATDTTPVIIDANGNVGIGTTVATSSFVIGNGGHILSQGGTPPTVSACGTGAAVVSTATDNAGHVTVGTGTISSCTITFATAWDRAPHCQVQSDTSSNKTFGSLETTTTMTITSASAFDSEVIDWICMGN